MCEVTLFLWALVFQKPEDHVPNGFQGPSSSSGLGFWGPEDGGELELLEMVPIGTEMGPWRFTVGSTALDSRHGVGRWGGWPTLPHLLSFTHFFILSSNKH